MKIKAVGVFIFCLLLVRIVYGHSGASGIVKERMDAMTDMADKSSLVADMFKGKSEFDRSVIFDAAEAFVRHGERMAELFPNTKESRTGSETAAMPNVWEDWDGFNKLVTEFVEHGESLKSKVSTTDDVSQLKIAFFRTTKDCSGCHKRYRKPKE